MVELLAKISNWYDNNLISLTSNENNFFIVYDETITFDYYSNLGFNRCFLLPNYNEEIKSVVVRNISMTHCYDIHDPDHQPHYSIEIMNDISREFCKKENSDKFRKDNYVYGIINESNSDSLNECYQKIIDNNYNLIYSKYSSTYITDEYRYGFYWEMNKQNI